MVVDRPTGEGPLVEVIAMVDSGAFRSSFPLQIAHDLGITDDELTEDPSGGTGVGSTFRFWTTHLRVRAGVGLFTPAADGTTPGWGPGFTLSPAFTEHNVFLLGRADFFTVFTVSFAVEAGEGVLYLDAPDPVATPQGG